MKIKDYEDEMAAFLDYENDYQKVSPHTAARESATFKKEARKILRRLERGRKLINHLEKVQDLHHERFSKTHKTNVPMRPITSA